MYKVFFLFLLAPSLVLAQPCTTNNAAGCSCPDGTDTCSLLPDITVSWLGILTHEGIPDEYSQSGNGSNNGRLRFSVSTPNIGYGPLTVRGTDYYICGSDTIVDSTGSVICPGGGDPTNMLIQRIYRKENGTMTFNDHFTGGQTYHPTHGHNHVDDWARMTLRLEDPTEPDTLKWPVVGTGTKLGFCLMDYGTCDEYLGHCRDNQTYNSGNILTNADFPNYGLGGGSYSCSPLEQGISVGHTDIYRKSLPEMWIDIPPNTCNGEYWIVVEVDFNNAFLESNENNNWTAVPITLTKQTPFGQAVAEITTNDIPVLCNNSSVTLEASTATTYLWSTGDTTQSVTVSAPGDYFVEVQSQCGNAVSDTLSIDILSSSVNSVMADTTCGSGSLNLSASGSGNILWFDTFDTYLDSGNTFETPFLTSNATYFVKNISTTTVQTSVGPANHVGSDYSGTTFNGYLLFDCYSSFILKSVTVITDYSGFRTIELRDQSGNVIEDTSLLITQGTSRISLNFNVQPGTDYQLGTNEVNNLSVLGFESPLLKRSDADVDYPYLLDGVVSIHNSAFGSSYYYYFYDWEIIGGSFACASQKMPVTAVVLDEPVVSFSGLDSVYHLSDSEELLLGEPAGGMFIGPGVDSADFNPMDAGIGQHSIVYHYIDDLSCYSSDTQTVNVIPDRPVADAGEDVAICSKDSVVLTADGGGYYLWSTGDTGSSILVSPDTTFTYSVTVSNGFGDEDVDSVIVMVHPNPTVNFNGLNSIYLETAGPVTLTGTPSGGTFFGPGINGNSFDPAAAGVGGPYEIVYAYNDENDCSGSFSGFVTVVQDNTVNINHIGLVDFSVYPNPSDGMVNIMVNTPISVSGSLIIYNTLGKQIQAYSLPLHLGADKKALRIDLNGFSEGIYFMQLKTPVNRTTIKIVLN